MLLVLLQAMLAGVAFVQGVLNFSVCSFGFDYLVKWSLVSKSVHRLHVHTKCVPIIALSDDTRGLLD